MLCDSYFKILFSHINYNGSHKHTLALIAIIQPKLSDTDETLYRYNYVGYSNYFLEFHNDHNTSINFTEVILKCIGRIA